MLMGGLSNSISVIGPRARTWRRSAIGTLPCQEESDCFLERHPGARACWCSRVEQLDGVKRGEQAGDRVGDGRTAEAGRVMTGRPATACFGREPISGAVVM